MKRLLQFVPLASRWPQLQWRVWDVKYGKKKWSESFSKVKFILNRSDLTGITGETFRICMIRPPQQIPPRESPRPQSDTGVSVAQQEAVTFTSKLFLPKLTLNSCAGSPGSGGLWAESHTWTGSCGLLVSDRRFWKAEILPCTWSP